MTKKRTWCIGLTLVRKESGRQLTAGLVTASFFSVRFLSRKDLPAGQINDSSSGQMLFSFATSWSRTLNAALSVASGTTKMTSGPEVQALVVFLIVPEPNSRVIFDICLSQSFYALSHGTFSFALHGSFSTII